VNDWFSVGLHQSSWARPYRNSRQKIHLAGPVDALTTRSTASFSVPVDIALAQIVNRLQHALACFQRNRAGTIIDDVRDGGRCHAGAPGDIVTGHPRLEGRAAPGSAIRRQVHFSLSAMREDTEKPEHLSRRAQQAVHRRESTRTKSNGPEMNANHLCSLPFSCSRSLVAKTRLSVRIGASRK
jgi:hypothetical protein